MSLFTKFASLAQVRASLSEAGVNPVGVPIDKVLSPSRGVIGGREVILAGTNNYLGLTFDPACIEASRAAALACGTGTTGSRMANGTYAGHLALERAIAEFFGVAHAIVFTTGYQANVGTIATLAGPGEVLLLDADSHASIYDGARLSGAEVIRFKHNDPDDLSRRLGRLAGRTADTLVVVEGIYSMLGDRAPLAEIVAVTREQGAWLLVDEAHSMGVLGACGRGLAEEVGVEAQIDFITGTFSKSLGAIGGYCVSRHPELELVRAAARAYVFTASPTPATIASTHKALETIRQRPALREQLWRNARRMYEGVKALGLRVGPEPSPVVATLFDDRQQALAAWRELLARGVYVNLVVPPAAPLSLLRCSLSAAHSEQQVDAMIEAYAQMAAVLHIGSSARTVAASAVRA